MTKRCLLPLILAPRRLQMVGERSVQRLRFPELAAELVHPQGVERRRGGTREGRLARGLGADESNLLNQRRVDERVDPAAVRVEVGTDDRARRRNRCACFVDENVLRADQLGEVLVRRLGGEDAVEVPEEGELLGVDRGVRRRVTFGVVLLGIIDRKDVLDVRVEPTHPRKPQ